MKILGKTYCAAWHLCRAGVVTGGASSVSIPVVSRLTSPNRGDVGVTVLFDVPGAAIPVFISQVPYRKRA